MARLLHRLGEFSTRRRGTVLAAWLVALVALGAAAGAVAEPFRAGFSVPGTESQRAIDLIEARTPGADADTASGRVVFAAPPGQSLESGTARTGVDGAVAALAQVPGIAAASDPYTSGGVSDDGRVAVSEVRFAIAEQDVSETQTAGVQRAVEAATGAGVRVEIGGAAAAVTEELPIGEVLGVAVAVLVLAVTFGSVLAAGLPLLTALVGVAVGVIGIFLATAFTAVSDTVLTLTLMLGLAVGVDYALLILTRHRNQVRDGMEITASIARATATAGSAVVFAGATVVIALVALLVTGIPFVAQMGLAAAGTVAVAVLVNLTLVPALMAVAGRRAVRGTAGSAPAAPGAAAPRTLGARWIALVVRRRRLAIALPVVALGLLAVPALDMRLALPGDGAFAPDATQRQAHDLVAESFGPGSNGPLTVAAEVPTGPGAQQAADAVADALARFDGVAEVSPAMLNPAGDLALIQVVPTTGPTDPATAELVTAVRDRAGTLATDTGATISVTGQTAVEIDSAQRMADALVPYLAVVVGLALLLLTVAFRSVLVPVTAVAGFLLTIAATFGAVVAVFQDGVGAGLFGVDQTGPLASVLPVIMIGVLFGLAMDYQVFLVSRMREEVGHGAGPRDAVVTGFRHGARVVTAAALIMTAVFAGFIVPDDPIIKSVGFAFAVGVLIDAFLVRMTLVPAVLVVLDRRAWWLPARLGRLVPDVDLDGATAAGPVGRAGARTGRSRVADPAGVE